STSFDTCRDRHSSSPSLHTSSGNTSHSGRRVLHSGSPNHSKSLCASVFLRLWIEHSLTAPKHILHLGLGGCILPLGCGFPHHDKARHVQEGIEPRTPDLAYPSDI